MKTVIVLVLVAAIAYGAFRAYKNRIVSSSSSGNVGGGANGGSDGSKPAQK